MKPNKKSAAVMPPLPEGFLHKMENIIGADETVRLAETLDGSPSVSIRFNRRKVSDPHSILKCIECNAEPVEWCKSGYYLSRRPDFVHDPLFHAGAYYVQEAASMIYEELVEELLKQQDSTQGSSPYYGNCVKVLDLCAAPGGKSTAMLNGLAGHQYILVANEFEAKRGRILKENLDRWGDPDVIITNSTTSAFALAGVEFDIVAVDAPCSGEGMMRREPVARTQWSESLVDRCVALQREILADAFSLLKPGGFLIYSTCTFNTEENERNAEWLVNELGLAPVGPPRRFLPHKDRCEGLFVAVFRKGNAHDLKPDEADKENTKANILSSLKKAGIKILSDGVEQTVTKGNVEIPSSRSVVAYDYPRNRFPEADLTREEAISYLRRNSLRLPEGTPLGFVCVTYNGMPLGLVKNIGTRANNLYPSEWRVLT